MCAIRNKYKEELIYMCFSKVQRSNACDDKTYEHANDDIIRDKILKGELTRDYCNNEEVFQFLALLKRRNVLIADNEDEMLKIEQRKFASRTKRRSTSSIFSMRDYFACECVLDSDRMVKFLVIFYNVMIKYNHYPSRWSKVVDAMIEQGKGPRLGKDQDQES